MNQPAGTMPEAKFRSTKKQATPASAIRVSEFAHEAAALKPKPQKVEAKAKAPKGEKTGLTLASFWPIAVGLFLSGFAAEWHGMAEQIGIWGMRFTFPFSLIATQKDLLGISNHTADVLPTIAVYAQLPIDGLLLMLTKMRTKSLPSAILQVTLIHAVCAFVLWLVTM
jgi:hypothetical protein